ncbi:hypothetical protein T281_12545 [Rhodomicrobium udaipurense JA643]|nr:hypothetical protein T281_12545 [Rhodomicrobium udaipurense JA643]
MSAPGQRVDVVRWWRRIVRVAPLPVFVQAPSPRLGEAPAIAALARWAASMNAEERSHVPTQNGRLLRLVTF